MAPAGSAGPSFWGVGEVRAQPPPAYRPMFFLSCYTILLGGRDCFGESSIDVPPYDASGAPASLQVSCFFAYERSFW